MALLAGVAAVVALLAGCSSGGGGQVAATTTTVRPADAPAYPAATAARFQAVLDQTRQQMGFPGVIAGVWSPQGTWVGTSGTTGQGQTAAPMPQDLTRVGSVTKTMTTTIILQLAAEGKLSLDDTIGRYVPGMPNGDTATLRQLADMQSGIPSYTNDQGWQTQLFADPTKPWTPQQLVDVVKGKAPNFAPGKGWEYSNTNTVLLGMVIEQIEGKPMDQIFQERIFGPLGMTSSTFVVNSTAIGDPHLSGITVQGSADGAPIDATNWNPSWGYTAGSVISNLDDMHTWAVALGTGEGILDPAMQSLRMDSINRTIPPNGAEAGYGFGIGERNGWWGHTGTLPGYNTVVYYQPSTRTAVVVEVNSDIAKDGKTPAPAVFDGLAAALGSGG